MAKTIDMSGVKAPEKKKGKAVDTEKSSNNLERKEAGETVLINFRVSPEVRRELKSLALNEDITMTEVLMRSIEAYKRTKL